MFRPSRRLFLGLAALVPVAACTSVPPDPRGDLAPISLAGTFSGRIAGTGEFRVPLIGLERRFAVMMNGTLRGDRLTLVEDFRWDDGRTERLTWVFDRTGDGAWDARREDTVGVARVVEDGRTIRMAYLADIRSSGEVTRLGFEDVIYSPRLGEVAIEAVVTRLGLPVGTVRTDLRRG
jgi:hypothetical protein